MTEYSVKTCSQYVCYFRSMVEETFIKKHQTKSKRSIILQSCQLVIKHLIASKMESCARSYNVSLKSPRGVLVALSREV